MKNIRVGLNSGVSLIIGDRIPYDVASHVQNYVHALVLRLVWSRVGIPVKVEVRVWAASAGLQFRLMDRDSTL